MTKSSDKKRRQREKRRKELDRLRGVSLADSVSPTPPIGYSPYPEIATHLTNYAGGDFASKLPQHAPTGPSREATAVVTSATGASTIPPVNAECEKQPSWKRVDFVLPKARGKKETYVFDTRRPALANNLPTIAEGNGHSNHQEAVAAKESKTNETIDDILFAKRKRQQTEDTSNSEAQDEKPQATDETTINGTKTSVEIARTDVLSEPRRKKLEETFEAVHREEVKSTIGPNHFVELLAKSKMQNSRPAVSSCGEVAVNDNQRPSPYVDSSNSKTQQLGSMKVTEPTVVAQPNANNIEALQPIGELRKPPPTPSSSSSSSKPETTVLSGQLSGRSVEEAVRDKHGLRPRANSTDGELNLPQRGLCDERMVLEAHKWNTETNRFGQRTPRGFHNLGNTCFLNATLQCLAYLPPFCQTLIAMSDSQERRKKDGKILKLYQGQRITSSLSSLFQQAHGCSAAQSAFVGGGAIAPKNIVKALPSIGSCGSRNGYKFHPGRQEDAHEFLVHLLDAMNDGELRSAGINQHISGWRDRLPVSRLDETTFIHRIFGGYFRSQVRCRQCGYRSNTYDPFLDLSLEVSKKSSSSVLNALSEFTRKETLDAANQWKCSGCRKYVCPTKQLTVFRPPLTLCIQLKRFTFDSGFGGNGLHGLQSFKFSKFHASRGGSKITKPIEFPANLDLPLSDGRSCPYTLTGIVIHVGGSASSGHYTAYVKKAPRKGTGQWYHMDDSSVEPVSEKTVLRQKDAYVLFYCRKEVKLEFPSPPPRSMSAAEAAEFGRARARARVDSFSKDEGKKQVPNGDSSDATMKEIERRDGGEESDLKMPAEKKLNAELKKKGLEKDLQKVKTKIHPLASPHTLAEYIGSQTAVAVSSMKKQPSSHESSSSSSGDDSSTSEGGVNGIVRGTIMTAKPKSDPTPRNDSGTSTSSGSGSSSDESSSDDSSEEDQNKPVESNIITQRHTGGFSQDLHSNNMKSSQAREADRLKVEEPSSEAESDDDDDPAYDDKKNDPVHARGKIGDEKEIYFGMAMNSPATVGLKPERNRTTVVLDSSDSRGKVKVMLGPRKRKFWESKAKTLPSKGTEFQLLGNMGVARWDEDEEGKGDQESTSSATKPPKPEVHGKRELIAENFDKQNRIRKRKMHLDRWDSVLDQGKTKKMKLGSKTADMNSSAEPKKNVFQRIQSGVQRMNRGKPKGQFPHSSNPKGKRGWAPF